jgi:hypothetical protein
MKNALKVIRDSAVEKRGTIYFKATQILAHAGYINITYTHADDIDITYTSKRAVKGAFIKTDKKKQKKCAFE